MFSSLGIQVLMAVYLGAGRDRDSLFVAMSVPFFLNSLMVGSISATITPTILSNQDVGAQRSILHGILIRISGMAVILALVLYLLRGTVIRLLAPGFGNEQQAFTANLFSYALPIIPFQAGTAVLSGYWVARERVFLPSISLLLGNLTIVGLMALAGWHSAPRVVFATLCGTSLGGIIPCVAYMIEQVPASARVLSRATNSPSKYYGQVAPLMLSGIVGRSTSIIERRLASPYTDGTLSCLSYAGYLVSFLVSATTAPAATAYYSQLCQHWNAGNQTAIASFLQKGLRIVITWSLAAAGIILLTFNDLFHLVLPWTRFTVADAARLTSYIQIMMIAYVFLACTSFVGRIYYISGRFVQASLLDCGGFLIYIAAASILTRFLGGYGLAVATTIYAVILCLIYFFSIHHQFEVAFDRRFWGSIFVWFVVWMAGLGCGFLLKHNLGGYLGVGTGAFVYVGVVICASVAKMSFEHSA